VTRPGRADALWGRVSEHADGQGAPISVSSVCAVAAARLPVTGAAISMRSGLVPATALCATDELSRGGEELQLTLGEGPSLDVLDGGPSVWVNDLSAPDWQVRWPLFAPQAVESGAGAVFGVPMRIGAIRGGVLALYNQRPGPLSPEQVSDAWVYASLALQVILDERSGTSTGDGYPAADALSAAGMQVHQATGMLSVQLGLGLEDAFSWLRARAFADGRTLSGVAEDVVARRLVSGLDDS
jgi:hypothetical protein